MKRSFLLLSLALAVPLAARADDFPTSGRV